MVDWANHDAAIRDSLRAVQRHYTTKPGPTPRRMAPLLTWLRRISPDEQFASAFDWSANAKNLSNEAKQWDARLRELEALTLAAASRSPDVLDDAYLEAVGMPLVWGAYVQPDGKTVVRKPPEFLRPITLDFMMGVHTDSMSAAWTEFKQELGQRFDEVVPDASDLVSAGKTLIFGGVAVALGAAGFLLYKGAR